MASPAKKDGSAGSSSSKSAALAKRVLALAFAVAFIVAGWWLTALAVNSPALPAPIEAFSVFANYFQALLPDLLISSYRIIVAIAIATVIAVPLAIICARSRRLDALFAPVLYLLYPVPKVVFLPVLLVLLGLEDAPKVALVGITVFFQVLVGVRDAARAVPEESITAIRALGAGKFVEYVHVVLPLTMPAVFTSLRISVGTAIAVLFFAESIGSSSGVGNFIMQSWARVNYPRMFAGIIALALLGIILYAVFDAVERSMTRWRG